MPKVTKAYKEERRIAILDGALHCFAEKGYRDTTISDIAGYLRVSKGVIYIYFASKEDIYRQLMEYRMTRMTSETEKAFATIPSPSGKLRHMIHMFSEQPMSELRKLLSFHLEFSLISSRQAELKPVMEKHAESGLQFVMEIIAEGKHTGEFRKDADERTAAMLFWALRDGLALHALHDEANERAVHMALIEAMVFRYLSPVTSL